MVISPLGQVDPSPESFLVTFCDTARQQSGVGSVGSAVTLGGTASVCLTFLPHLQNKDGAEPVCRVFVKPRVSAGEVAGGAWKGAEGRGRAWKGAEGRLAWPVL